MRKFIFVDLFSYLLSAQAAMICKFEPFDQLAECLYQQSNNLALMVNPACSMKAMQVSEFADTVAQCAIAPMTEQSCETKILEKFHEIQNTLKKLKCL